MDPETFLRLAPLACQWARTQEELILRMGVPLGEKQLADARLAGVQDPTRVRILVVDRVPLPDEPPLAEAAARAQIIPRAARGMAIGHGIIIRADCWPERELVLHQLVHVAQCERAGCLENFVQEYLCDRTTCADFTLGSLEGEARGLAREICAGKAVKFSLAGTSPGREPPHPEAERASHDHSDEAHPHGNFVSPDDKSRAAHQSPQMSQRHDSEDRPRDAQASNR